MLKFSANLSMLFQEADFLDRFKASAQAGFQAVEFMFPYDFDPEVLRKKLDENCLNLVLFNLPAGDWQRGERGIALNPAQKESFREGVRAAVKYAKVLGVKQVNCLVGKKIPGIDDKLLHRTLLENLRLASSELGDAGVKLLLEFVNNYDIPGFYLHNTASTLGVIEETGNSNIYLQYDIYHAQRSEGEIIATMRKHVDKIAHIQLADNPGRHEPGTGELNYLNIFKAINQMGYEGYVGLEYIPQMSTVSSLGWIQEYGLIL